MKVLNLEDTATKHVDICKVLNKSGITDIDWVKNLEGGIALLQENPEVYDLVITDMYYPLIPGGPEAVAGDVLIHKMKEELQLNIPIIVCSSARYRNENIFGAVHYSEKSDWERLLQELVDSLKAQ